MPVASSLKPNSNSTSAQNATTEPDFNIDCVPNFNGIEQLFYVFAFTRVIFFLVPMITGNFSKGSTDQRSRDENWLVRDQGREDLQVPTTIYKKFRTRTKTNWKISDQVEPVGPRTLPAIFSYSNDSSTKYVTIKNWESGHFKYFNTVVFLNGQTCEHEIRNSQSQGSGSISCHNLSW